jgi:predicted O-methyltransferase YrrM
VNATLMQFLAGLAEFGQSNDARETERARRMLNITPETGRLLWILARSMRAKRILEVGTSNAYSTIWLADAVQPFGGRVTTLEYDANKVRVASANLATAGLQEVVEIMAGRASDTLAALTGPFDIVFLDADRASYLSYMDLVVPMLRSGGLLVADNATSHAQELETYLRGVEQHPDLFAVTVPIGNGEQIALKL